MCVSFSLLSLELRLLLLLLLRRQRHEKVHLNLVLRCIMLKTRLSVLGSNKRHLLADIVISLAELTDTLPLEGENLGRLLSVLHEAVVVNLTKRLDRFCERVILVGSLVH